jgi:alpha-tubulin suppressor-like RCC1 family protein
MRASRAGAGRGTGCRCSLRTRRWRSETDLAFASVAIGQQHICALAPAGAAYCWGSNWAGQLGIGWYGQDLAEGGGGDPFVETPQAVLGGHAFAELAMGMMSTCGLTSTGAVYCWGSDHSNRSNVPERIDAAPAFVAIYGGSTHWCALTDVGAAYCWGENWLGTLGDGTREHRAAPVAVDGGLVFVELALGGHTCGLTTGGEAYCWGGNPYGQIGRPGREAPPGLGLW